MTPDLEQQIVRYALDHGDAGDGDGDAAELAWRIAESEDAIAFAFRLAEDASLLRTVARARLGADVTGDGAACERLEALLDDVMVVRAELDRAAHGAPPSPAGRR